MRKLTELLHQIPHFPTIPPFVPKVPPTDPRYQPSPQHPPGIILRPLTPPPGFTPIPIVPDPDPTHKKVKTPHTQDPNDKIGPGGSGDSAFVQSDGVLPYQVDFENVPTANAPVKQVVVTDQLDENLDLNSFQLSEIDFANQTITIPPRLDRYQTQVPFDANGTMIVVDVRATLDRSLRKLTLTLQCSTQTQARSPKSHWLASSIRTIAPAEGWVRSATWSSHSLVFPPAQ